MFDQRWSCKEWEEKLLKEIKIIEAWNWIERSSHGPWALKLVWRVWALKPLSLSAQPLFWNPVCKTVCLGLNVCTFWNCCIISVISHFFVNTCNNFAYYHHHHSSSSTSIHFKYIFHVLLFKWFPSPISLCCEQIEFRIFFKIPWNIE